MILPDHQARSLLAPRRPAATAPWIAVSGGKGGVGKTLFAVNLALLTARAGYRPLLVDLDPGLGNVGVHLRIAPRFSIEDLADGACEPQQAVVHGPGGIAVLGGESGSSRLASGDVGYLRQVVAAVAGAAAGRDVVICDTGAGIGPAVVEAVRRAAVALAITTPDPAAVTDTYAFTKLLVGRGIPAPRLVVNGVRSRDEAMRTAAHLAAVCRKFLATEVSLCGWLCRSAEIERSVHEQRPFCLTGSGPALDDLQALTAAVLSALPLPARRPRPSAAAEALRRLAR